MHMCCGLIGTCRNWADLGRYVTSVVQRKALETGRQTRLSEECFASSWWSPSLSIRPDVLKLPQWYSATKCWADSSIGPAFRLSTVTWGSDHKSFSEEKEYGIRRLVWSAHSHRWLSAKTNYFCTEGFCLLRMSRLLLHLEFKSEPLENHETRRIFLARDICMQNDEVETTSHQVVKQVYLPLKLSSESKAILNWTCLG